MSELCECKNCLYWQDYKPRVFAKISQSRSNMTRNIIELRPCRNVPPPMVDTDFCGIYTDENYMCSGWIKNET